MGTAKSESPKLALISPSYNTTPAANRLPAAAAGFGRPRKSELLTLAAIQANVVDSNVTVKSHGAVSWPPNRDPGVASALSGTASTESLSG